MSPKVIPLEVKKKMRFTYEDYLSFPEDRHRHELIDGEHFMTPSPNFKHQRISARLENILYNFVDKYKLGVVLDAPMDVILSEFDVVEPDIIYISNQNRGIITERAIEGVPDLIVEIISVSSRKMDKVIKKKLYEHYGVSEYWIIDPEIDLLEVYKLSGSIYIKAGEYEPGAQFFSPLFEHDKEKLLMDVSTIFA